MLNVKLFVLIGFLIVDKCRSRYCEICPNHTLCLFPLSGPSPSCKGYDTSALLTKHDISGIINRINNRRNFVALGLSKKLPSAANMRKMDWSEELATSAQRWADQCDPCTRPDREDYCRNLDNRLTSQNNRLAGQNIATITGLSPGMNIKSFVDIWFMQTLYYMGSVSYYNQSQDVRTSYFTQLIWAETQEVGCGKARFLIDYGQSVIERLVCNFAPKGNIHGKPVYAIGVAATQCPENMKPDDKYVGLCSQKDKGNEGLTSKSPTPVRSSLRILNLSNNSTRLEIDPIRSNINLMKLDYHNSTSNQRNQKIRHVLINNTHAGIPHVHKQQKHSNNIKDTSRNPGFRRQNTEERGHSRVYHSHNHNDRDLPQYRGSTERYFRRLDDTTKPLPIYSSSNYRKQNQLCTRTPAGKTDLAVNELVTNKCTRGMKNNCCTPAPPTNLPPHDFDFHNTHKPTNCQSTDQCGCTIISCPKITKNKDQIRMNCDEDTRKSSEFHYYDLYPYVELRSAVIDKENLHNKDSSFSNKNHWLLRNTAVDNNSLKPSPFTKIYQQNKKVKDPLEIPKYIDPEHEYSYDSFDSSQRQKRKQESHITLKPFWQVDDYSYNQPVQLKSIRYTTLTHKLNRNHKKSSAHIGTEPITIKMDPDIHDDHKDRITEKYLSFDELMHLRRFNAQDYDARRQSKAIEKNAETTTKKKSTKHKSSTKEKETTVKKTTIRTTTEEYTTNTPFVRLKHCTRKLTCTWTAASMTGSDGRIIDPGNRVGSRTPPGYVEGCTRTSTCTRDFFNRNIISTTTIDMPVNDNDDDYCERRSLNVQRRNSDNEDGDVYEDAVTNTNISLSTMSTPYFGLNINSQVTDTASTRVAVDETLVDDCNCDKEYTRTKRSSEENQLCCTKTCNKKQQQNYHNNLLIGKTWEDNENSSFLSVFW